MKLKERFTGFWTILKTTAREWKAADPFRQSAVVAYYAIFSLPALLVLIINVVGLFFEKETVSGEVARQIEGLMGRDTAEQVGGIVEKAGAIKAGFIPGLIAVVTIIFGATGVFVQLQKSLDEIWEVKQKPNLGFVRELKNQLFSFGLILSIGFLLLVSLVISSALAAFSFWLEGVFSEGVAYLFYVLEFLVSFGVICTLFALMFKLLPDVKMPWRNVWVGSFLTGVLFLIGKYALSFYFGKAQPASAYGAAGSIILILLWVSYSSMIVFFGAEFTRQYALYHKIDVPPTRDAQKIQAGKQPDSLLQAEKDKKRVQEPKLFEHSH